VVTSRPLLQGRLRLSLGSAFVQHWGLEQLERAWRVVEVQLGEEPTCGLLLIAN